MDISLIVIAGSDMGRTFTVAPGETALVGRNPAAAVCLTDDGVSRNHCQIVNQGSEVVLHDLGSSNGTFVNGEPVREARLRTGDVIVAGRVRMAVRSRSNLLRARRETRDVAVTDDPVRFRSRRVGPSSGGFTDIAPSRVSSGASRPERDLIRLHALHRVSLALQAATDPDRAGETVVEAMLDVTPAQRAALLLRDGDIGPAGPCDSGPSDAGSHLQVAAMRCKAGSAQDSLRISRTILSDVLTNAASVLTEDAMTDTRFRGAASVILQGIRSAACVPLRGRSAILGVLYGDTTDASCSFDDLDLELMSALGSQAGLAVERARLVARLEELFIGANRALVAAVEARDPYTRGHSDRVSAYSLAIAHEMGLPADVQDVIELAALLHDVGKIGVPEAVLQKQGRLDADEYRAIQRHPAQGADIVRHIRHPAAEDVTRAVRGHHERPDGKGYPDGLVGDAITLPARILAVADAFDALTTDRPYRKGMGWDAADRILQDIAGQQLDPDVVAAFLRCRESGSPLLGEHGRAPQWRSRFSGDPDETVQAK